MPNSFKATEGKLAEFKTSVVLVVSSIFFPSTALSGRLTLGECIECWMFRPNVVMSDGGSARKPFCSFKEAAQGGRTSGCQHERVPHREILNAFLVAPQGLFLQSNVFNIIIKSIVMSWPCATRTTAAFRGAEAVPK